MMHGTTNIKLKKNVYKHVSRMEIPRLVCAVMKYQPAGRRNWWESAGLLCYETGTGHVAWALIMMMMLLLMMITKFHFQIVGRNNFKRASFQAVHTSFTVVQGHKHWPHILADWSIANLLWDYFTKTWTVCTGMYLLSVHENPSK